MTTGATRSRSWAAAALTVLLAAGCGLRREPGLVLAPGNDALLFGQVTRDGQPIVGQLVKLYDDGETVLFDSLRTDPAGHYGFVQVPAGGVMVKASSVDSSDFSYVRFLLTRGTSTERDSVPPMDLRAHGCTPVLPADSSGIAAPNPGAPLTFTWLPVAGVANLRYKVRLADLSDSTVWEPPYATTAAVTFNGIGTSGSYAGRLVPPGVYLWRVKVRFPTGVTAATRSRRITFQGAAL